MYLQFDFGKLSVGSLCLAVIVELRKFETGCAQALSVPKGWMKHLSCPFRSFSYSFFPFSASVTNAACCRTVGANSLGGSLVPAGLLFQSVQCSLSIKGTSPEGLPLTPTTVPTPSEAKPEFWTSRNGWYTFPLKVLLRTGSVLGLQGTGDVGSRLGRA